MKKTFEGEGKEKESDSEANSLLLVTTSRKEVVHPRVKFSSQKKDVVSYISFRRVLQSVLSKHFRTTREMRKETDKEKVGGEKEEVPLR